MSLSTKLKVGAGEAPMLFPEAMFPTGGMENYTGVHDYPYVHTVLLEHSGVRYAILAVDIVGIPDAEGMRARAAQVLEVPYDNVIITNAHVLTTPHNFHRAQTPEEKAKEDMLDAAIMDALDKSLEKAKATFGPGLFGYKEGYTNFVVNRVMETEKGWGTQATNDEGDTDHGMPVFRFDNLEGKTLAILYVVNCAAGMLEFTHSDDGGRLVSNDIAGASADFVRQEFGEDCVCMYLCGATGDQWQAMRGIFGTVGRGGVYRQRDLGDKGWLLLELMGERLGQQIVRAADSIECKDVEKITFSRHAVKLPGRVQHRGKPGEPRKPQPLEKGEDVQVMVTTMTFDDLLWIGATPEIQVATIRAIKEASPFKETAFSGWTNEGKDSTGTYMAEDYMYDLGTYQAGKSRFYLGAAQSFRDQVIDIIKKL